MLEIFQFIFGKQNSLPSNKSQFYAQPSVSADGVVFKSGSPVAHFPRISVAQAANRIYENVAKRLISDGIFLTSFFGDCGQFVIFSSVLV